MICFDKGNDRFNFRIAGVAINDNKILLHKNINDSFWALPGGRNEFNENSELTLIREMKEEIGETIGIEKLLWVIENFLKFSNKNFHEISLIYLMDLDKCTYIKEKNEFDGIEKEVDLLYKWFDLDKIQEVELYPACLKTRLNNLPNNIEHIIHYDD